jgi:hypothetical protein
MSYLCQTVIQSIELSLSGSLSDIRSESGSGKIQRIYETQRTSPGSPSGQNVSECELPWVSLRVKWAQVLLKCVFESKVQSLSGEISSLNYYKIKFDV